MMLVNRKQDSVRKPLKFNLGGLIKKKITWKKNIDSLASSLDDMQIDYPPNDPSYSQTYSESYPPHSLPSHQQPPQQHLPSEYTSASSTITSSSTGSSSDQQTSTEVPPSNVYTHSGHPVEPRMSFATDCISLPNSDMTAIDRIGSDANSFSAHNADSEAAVPYDEKLEESPAEYKPGGYHPVKLGDSYSSDINRYRVLRKLGWGHFSTVWLCVSLMTGAHVALKLVKSGSNYSDAARDEIRLLKTLQGHDEDDTDLNVSPDSSFVNLLDHFEIEGPNGTHIAIVFELMGENMLHLIYKSRAERLVAPHRLLSAPLLFDFDMATHIISQILHAVHGMHQRGVIHTDIKPENILLKYHGKLPHNLVDEVKSQRHFQVLPSQPLTSSLEEIKRNPLVVKIADLGNATYSHQHFTNHIQTRQYRAPEIILKHDSWGASADVWSVGCVIFELLTGDYLFDPKEGETFARDEDHLAQIIELVEEFPSAEYLAQCEYGRKYFTSPTSLRNIHKLKFWKLQSVLVDKYKLDPKDDRVKLICDLILKCLRYDLRKRYDCGSLLAHPFFRKNARFNQRECDELPNHNRQVPGFTREE